MKERVQVAIIGGGVTGCSIAYHLAKAGWSDVVLIERSELTAGSTWHAAGGTGAFGGGANATYLHNYSFELYPKLEAETGQSCGFHHVGQLMLARTDARLEDLKRHHVLGERHGLKADWLTPEEALEKAPILDMSSIKGILYEHSWGHVDPNGVTHAFAKGARNHGAEIYRFCPVRETNQRPDGSWDVVTEKGDIHAQHIVNAAGLWAREVAAMAGIKLPLMPVEHHYFVTEAVPEIEALDFEVPLISDADAEYYMRQEGKGLLLGVYEDTCTHWSVDGTPHDFSHDLLPNALDRIERNLEQACEAVPPLGRAGIKSVINGPMIFSPDLGPLIGPYPGLKNYWTACGIMTGFSQSAAIGMVMEGWMSKGEPPLDVSMWDVARYGDWADADYAAAKTADMYSTRFQTIYPYEERSAGRPALTTPAYETYKKMGAYFGESDGVEFPLWFAPEGSEPKETLTYHRPNWFEPVAKECKGLHEGVGIIDITTYGKHRVSGPGAKAWLEYVMTNRMPKKDGRLILSAMLSHSGHMMGEYSVARVSGEEFYLFGNGLMDRAHHRWWDEFLPADGVKVESMTRALCAYSVSGPNARALLEKLCDFDISNEAWPYRQIGRGDIGPAKDALLLRVAYTGELGFEIYVAPEHQVAFLEAMLEAGQDLGVTMAGIRTLNSMRIEKGFGAWGLEYALDYTPFESAMGYLVKFDKDDFVGKDAVAKLKGQERYFYRKFEIEVDDIDPWGGEPIMSGDQIAGFISSAAFGHRTGKSVALGYVYPPFVDQTDGYAVDILGEKYPVRLLDGAAFDPTGARMRG